MWAMEESEPIPRGQETPVLAKGGGVSPRDSLPWASSPGTLAWLPGRQIAGGSMTGALSFRRESVELSAGEFG